MRLGARRDGILSCSRKAFSVALALGGLLATTIVDASHAERTWEEWPRVEGATAVAEEEQLAVYRDPRNPDDLLLFPTCWMILVAEREILSLGCGYAWRLAETRLLFDETYRPGTGDQRLEGAPWGDPKLELSIFSRLFRRPRFSEGSLTFWDGKRRILVKGLPPPVGQPRSLPE